MLIYVISTAPHYRNEMFVNETDIDNKIKMTLFFFITFLHVSLIFRLFEKRLEGLSY